MFKQTITAFQGLCGFAGILMAALVLPSYGQDTSKYHVIIIKVRDSDVKKISGAVVTAYDKSKMNVISTVTTAADGNAKFTLPTFHDYIISVTKKGYLTEKVWVSSQPIGKEHKTMLHYLNEVIVPVYNALTKDVGAELIGEYAIKISYFPPGNHLGIEGNTFDIDKDYQKNIQSKASKLDPQARAEAFNTLISGGTLPSKHVNNPGNVNSPDNAINYDELMKKADQLFIDKEFAKAKENYERCLTLKPKEKRPKDQLEKINKMYKDAVLKADNLLMKKQYEYAKDAYEVALTYNQQDKYPKDKIKEINKLLKQPDRGTIEDYASLIALADKSFLDKNYAYAKYYYGKAIKQKPAEKYPKGQLAKVNAAFNTAAYKNVLNAQYNDAMKKGKESFDSKDYETARDAYAEACILKPEQNIPKTQLVKTEALIKSALKELEEKYNEKAKSAYHDALVLKPNESYPKNKLDEIGRLMQIKAPDNYQLTIDKADLAFNEKDYAGSRRAYVQASAINPTEKYPKDKIAEIDQLLKGITVAIESLSTGNRKDIINSQVIQQLQEKHDELLERSKQLKLLRRAYVKRMANLSTKYDTENPMTKLLDIVDSKPSDDTKK
jgi:hypothetical protein